MSKGLTVSSLLHLILLVLMIVGLPRWLEPDPIVMPPVMVVEVVPIGSKTNVRASKPQEQPPVPKEAPKPEPQKPEPKKEEKKPEPPKPEPKKEAEKAPVKPEPKKEEKKPEVKPEPKKEEKKKEEPKKDEFAEILKNISKKATEQGSNDTNPNKAINTSFDESQPLSVSEIDYMKQRIKQCWNVGAFAGMRDSNKLVVKLRLTLFQDGTVNQVTVEEQGRMNDPLFRVAAETAIRAVRQCSPFDKLPPDKYNSWKEMTMSFDPSEMLY